jgi:hypothetical protein
MEKHRVSRHTTNIGPNKSSRYWCKEVGPGIFASWKIVVFVLLGLFSGVNLSLLNGKRAAESRKRSFFLVERGHRHWCE